MEPTNSRRLAIVTGTSSGVGRATSDELLAHRWDVIGVSRRASPSEDKRYRHVRVDLADVDAVVAAFEEVVAPIVSDGSWSRVGLVNNAAGLALLGPIQTLKAAELSVLYAVNLVAPVWLMGFVSRHCPRDAALRVVNVSSGAAVTALPGMAAYSSSKAALRMAGMVLAAEWQSTVEHAPTRANASVLSYEPGVVDTPMQDRARSMDATEFPWVGMFTAMRDQGRLVSADRPAREIVAYLESHGQSAFSEKRLG